MAVNDDLDALALQVGCPTCGQGVAQWCVTRGAGTRTHYMHAARTAPVWSAYGVGFSHGSRDRHTWEAPSAKH